MTEYYKTAVGLGEAVIIEKKSKFISTVLPVSSEQEAQNFILEMRKKYWDATHNVYAYRVGLDDEIVRFSDDGEPNGTAGHPVLELLKTSEVQDTIIVVTRYFGGTLLGTGGLIRAYGQAAKAGLNNAGIIGKVLSREILVETDYNIWGRVQYETQRLNFLLENVEYGENVCAIFLVDNNRIAEFQKKIADISNGQAKIICGNEKYAEVNQLN